MVTEKRLRELYEKGRQRGFVLPPGIMTKKCCSVEGYHVQVFYHEILGELGHIIIIPRGAETQICCKVLGKPGDPMTKTRMDILAPLTKQIIDTMEDILSESTDHTSSNGVKHNQKRKKQPQLKDIFPVC